MLSRPVRGGPLQHTLAAETHVIMRRAHRMELPFMQAIERGSDQAPLNSVWNDYKSANFSYQTMNSAVVPDPNLDPVCAVVRSLMHSLTRSISCFVSTLRLAIKQIWLHRVSATRLEPEALASAEGDAR